MASDTGDSIHASSGQWSFGGDTPKNFDQHVSKSVPLYFEGHQLIANLSQHFVPQCGSVIHVGCSTGVLTQHIASELSGRQANILAVDIEENMIAEAKSRDNPHKINFLTSDFLDLDVAPNSVNLIVCHYVIQFIHPSVRQLVVDKIYASLCWGGALIMFEKIRASDARFQDIFTTSYHDFKISSGYSPSNVYAKQQSLRSVLEPFSSNGNFDMLKRSGFVDIETIFQYIPFKGFLAIK